LIAEIGAKKFLAWFGETRFEPGPPVRIVFAKPFQQRWVAQNFASELKRALGSEPELALAEASPSTRTAPDAKSESSTGNRDFARMGQRLGTVGVWAGS
jgi:hypothetical protein